MTNKIFKSILIVAGSVLLASLILIMGCLYEYFGNIQRDQLTDELNNAAAMVEEYGNDYLKEVDSQHYRITWIDSDGTVIYDTQTGADNMENHADRQEFQQALKEGQGKSTRYSATLLEKTTYLAKALNDGTVLRISASYATAGLLALGMLQPFLVVLVVALFLSGVLAHKLSKRIVEPLNRLDLENPLENDTYEELTPLLNRINQQHKEISLQLRKLQRRRDEFEQITGSMKEALILLDINGTILSINPAAQKIFGNTDSCVGDDFLTIDRSHDISMAIKAAMADGHREVYTEREGRKYQVDISRIESGGAIYGCVILGFDITDHAFAERNRREFTANVSHELKTPLQGIIGSADLIESGMVKPEDMPRFVGHIRKEATRLVALIDDIIRLSQLDEENEMPCEDIDLYELAEEVKDALSTAADSKNIKITLNRSVDGSGSVIIHGVRRLLYEIIYNLCDNAIKYNTDGGTVQLDVVSDEKTATVTVRDNGIGIAPEDQSRIFERFYRVDKSHSKASGGTGLGLSIVKHAVQYHHGRIDIQSEPDKGTAISVTFPI